MISFLTKVKSDITVKENYSGDGFKYENPNEKSEFTKQETKSAYDAILGAKRGVQEVIDLT